MNKKHSTPHDHYFRTMMADPKVSNEFFVKHLPEKIKKIIDLQAITTQPTNYIDEHLRLQTSDMLFCTALKQKPNYIYILVEHQSTPPKKTCHFAYSSTAYRS
jgi:predicted transposase/invertase (TIGR01784 family)